MVRSRRRVEIKQKLSKVSVFGGNFSNTQMGWGPAQARLRNPGVAGRDSGVYIEDITESKRLR